MRWLVCGGRDFIHRKFIFDKLDELFNKFYWPVYRDEFEIIHGTARGVDNIAGQWAKESNIRVKEFPADWDKYGKKAGYLRNKQMLEEGKPDLVIAFPGGRGTAMMVKLARYAGVEVIEIGYPTTI